MRICLAAAIGVMSMRIASASCPQDGAPDKSVCEQVNAFFMPGLTATAYFPNDSANLGHWYGGGVQVVPFLWSRNSDRFGPGQGKLLFDINLLKSSKDGVGTMLLYRFGGQLSLEKNASRAYAIPYFGVMFGGLNVGPLNNVGFFEFSLGLHALYLRNVVVTLELGYVFPFSDVDQLHGLRTMLAGNFTLW
jgi:hypothetical protein